MTPSGTPTPVLYLDLDGTVRKGKTELGYFVNTADQVEVFEGVPDLLYHYKEVGYRLVGITNQGGVALGFLDLADCRRALLETNRQCRNLFDFINVCQHHPDAEDPTMAYCWCRKPRIGLIVEAAILLGQRHPEYYPPHMAVFVGDMDSDQECAENAGIPFLDAAEWRTGEHLRTVMST
jgi:D-glycero-D-manno-heptose 1,7-bisphosphate phosphatase